MAPAGLPSWLSSGPTTLSLTYDGASIILGFSGSLGANPDGQSLSLSLSSTLSLGATAGDFELQATLDAPWGQPFGVPWLTIDAAELVLTSEVGGGFSARLESTFTVGTKTFQLDLEVTGTPPDLDASINATSLDPISTTDIANLLVDVVGLAPLPSGLPELSLNNVSLSIETGPAEALSISADVTFAGVNGAVLFSVVDRDGDPATPSEFLFAMNLDSFTLSDLGVPMPEPLNSFPFPEVSLSVVGVPLGETLSVPSSDLTPPELSFFSGVYGPPPFTVDLKRGLNLAAEIPLSQLPEPILTALGSPTGVIRLEGNLDINLAPIELVSLSLRATMPSGLTLPNVPDWISTISINTGASTVLSISADVNFLGVSGSVLFSVTDRDNVLSTPPDFLFGVNIPAFQLSQIGDSVGISLPEPLASFEIPEVAFVVAGTPGGGTLSINSSELSVPEFDFFSGAFGGLPDFTINLQPGLNLSADIPLSVLPAPILTALGSPTGVIRLEGSVVLNLGLGTSPSLELVSLSLKAVLPPGLSLPGLPAWISTAPPGGLSLELGYDNSTGGAEINLAVAGDFVVDLNGTPSAS